MLIDLLRDKHPHLLVDTPLHRDLLATIRAQLSQTTLIKANNVAEYLYQGTPQENWDLLTDFPCVAPPFPYMWIEWQIPNWSNREGHIEKLEFAGSSWGVFIAATEPTAQQMAAQSDTMTEEQKIWGMLQMASLREHGPALTALVESLGEMDVSMRHHALQTAPLEVRTAWLAAWDATQQKLGTALSFRWRLAVFHFARLHRQLSFLPREHVFLLNATGQVINTGQHCDDGTEAAFVTIAYDLAPRAAGTPSQAFFIPMLTLSFMNCKNVTIVERRRPLSERRPKAKHWTATYKELEILPMRKILEDTQRTPGIRTLQRSLHLCRGHFANYTEGKGLFGKYHGQFWVPQHVRGSAEHGVVEKDYAVQAPQKKESTP